MGAITVDNGIHAVVFDLDGVIIDSEGLWDEVRRGLAAENGRPWPDDATHLMMGMSTPEWSAYLADTVGVPGTAGEVAETVIGHMAKRYRQHLPLLPGSVEAVRRLAQQWPLGLASSSPRRLIDSVLLAADLTDAFRVTLSTEQVEEGKPSPAVYLAVAAQLDLPPETLVAIEDSSNGLRAASRAGMHVIAVPRPEFPPAADALSHVDRVVHGLDEVTVDLVRSLAS